MRDLKVMQNRKPVSLITAGYTEKNLRLQPWRYLSEIALQLAHQGHPVTVITDGGRRCWGKGLGREQTVEQAGGITIRRIPSVSWYAWRPNIPLQQAIQASEPSVILWHLGLPSFIYPVVHDFHDVPVVGIFPGIVYKPGELLRLGLKRLTKGYKLSAIHLAGLLVPRLLVRRAVAHPQVVGLVVQTESTAQRLLEFGLPRDQVKVILPGVDEIWFGENGNGTYASQQGTREKLGFRATDKVVLYFGSPAPLRGLLTLIRALELAREKDPTFKLLVLSRRHRNELLQEDAELRHLLENEKIGPHVEVISGFLPPDELMHHVDATDIVALPFELVPADAPLSVLEAQALGKPVVTTRVASLPEMVAEGEGYLAEPADPVSLAEALLAAGRNLERKRKSDHFIRAIKPARATRSWRKVGEEWSELLQAI